ncbi:hypothetical protein BJY21_002631 [Kineosphaera limosa]|uniref:Uncharacterized protein n=1 Tax=Kineosphaera limosa NBRC 100340 TaxID=1184609 RepID=K6X8P9_9MICO|nr:hypothetical protein [Kineosphaera limosa]NYE01447.1 hypothetical protein [Kineosphaera limosa]GAB95194.1 hypothetical protein KILIM_017_00390 [Kineosphaera limosa NBRC 100340]
MSALPRPFGSDLPTAPQQTTQADDTTAGNSLAGNRASGPAAGSGLLRGRPNGLAALRRVEIELLMRYAEAVGHGHLAPASVPVSEGSAVHVDGVDAARTLFVEAHAYRDTLDRAQLDLVVQDLFKLALVARANPQGRSVLLLGGHAAAQSLSQMRRRVPSLAEVEIVVVS